MDTLFVGLLIFFACTGKVNCLEYCYTGYGISEYCTYYCCESSSSYYNYCCTTKSVVQVWIAGPIVGGVVFAIAAGVTFFMCCCKTVNGMTRYQSFQARRVAGTTVTMTTSVNQQSTMNNMAYPPQQPYQGYPMYQQPFPMAQQPYAPGPQSSYPPPYSVSHGQEPSFLPKY